MARLTRGQAIRAKCIDCCCGNKKEVKLCPCSDCPLYRYRLGHEDAEGCNYTPEDESEENDSTLSISEEN